MQLFKHIGATILVVIVIVSITASCFATSVAIAPIDVFSTLYSTYLASRGIAVVMSEDNVASSSGNSIAADPAASMWLDIYESYNDSLSSSDQMTIDQWSSFAQQYVSTNVGPAGNVTPTQTTFSLGSQLVEWFDKLTTKVLTVDLGVPSESGVYHTGGNFFNSSIAAYVSSGAVVIPNVSNVSDTSTQGLLVGKTVPYGATILTASSSAVCYVGAYTDSNNKPWLYVKTQTSGVTVYYSYNGGSYSFGNSTYVDGWYVYGHSWAAGLNVEWYIPEYSSLEEFLGQPISDGSSTRIQLRPEDKYNEGLRDGEGNVLPKGDVYIPDATAEGYVADTLTGTWNLPWTDSYADAGSLPSILEGILDLVLANDSVLELDEVSPDPVEIPFLPPSAITDLPSFDFSLSGIWHYVVDWVSSLGAGFSLISSAWSALPYAMIIPIYASAVVVIVVGMWKRFFS